MNPATGVAAAKTAIGAGEIAYKGWSWFSKWRYGTIAITYPQNRAVVHPEWVEMEGTHNNPKGHFWLFTVRGNEYWPQCRINLHPDGRWKERINTGRNPERRTCIVLLVWVSDFMQSLLEDIKDRSTRAEYWGPVKMNPPKRHFSVAHSVALNVEPKPSA
jgi:hypothetical protein